MMKFIQQFNVLEVLKFCVGGGSAVLVDFVVYLLLKNIMAISIAKAASYIIGTAVGFLINKLWTFQCRKFRVFEIIKYITLYSCSAVANTFVNKFCIMVFSSVLLAFFFATGTSTVINFIGQKFLVFKKDGNKEGES